MSEFQSPNAVMTAKFHGRCGSCGYSILPGDPIVSAYGIWCHTDCDDAPVDRGGIEPVYGPPCETCWQQPAANGKCGCDL